MATYYFRNVGSDWGTATNWSLSSGGGADGAVPTNADNAVFDANSSSTITVSVTSTRVCENLTTTGWTGTLTLNNMLTVEGDTVLSATTTIAGASAFRIGAGSVSKSFTGNNVLIPNFQMAASNSTWTIVDSIECTNCTIVSTNPAPIVNGGPINIYGATAAINGMRGTSVINLLGNTTLSFNGATNLRNSINFNGGTMVVSGNIDYQTGTISHIAGTVTTTGSTLNIQASCTLDTDGINWNIISLSGTVTLTLASKLTADTCVSVGQNITFDGAAGFEFETFDYTLLGAVNRTISLTPSRSYVVNDNLILNNPTGSLVVSSSSGVSTATLVLTTGGLQNVYRTSATRIDSSGGEIIYTTPGQTLTTTTNWQFRPSSNFFF